MPGAPIARPPGARGRVFLSPPPDNAPTLPRVLFTCQAGYETWLARELGAAGAPPLPGNGRGWLRTAAPAPGRDWCFAHTAWLDAEEVRGPSVNALAGAIAGRFFESARGEAFAGPWPLVFAQAGGLEGLGRRNAAVAAAVRTLVQRRMARVLKLATAPAPRTGVARGLFVFLADFQCAWVAREAWFSGACRMADDPAAPSRSYLKLEEAYGVLGREPGPHETIVDLGAAPGGWSYSAARRGARVLAIDNGPLKGGALAHPRIEHRREDAFRFRPPAGARYDGLLCDLVEEPHHVLRAIVEPWLAGRWCRWFVVNFKFGRADALALREEVGQRLTPHCAWLKTRHLFHDREEFTVVGETRG